MSGEQDILNVYDSEVRQLLELQRALTDRVYGRQLNYNDFEREIREKAAELGFTVNVNWYEFEIDGVKQEGAMPEVTVTGRTDTAFRWDPDRQVHQAVNDVLGLGESGWIKTDPETLKRFLDGNGEHPHGHKH